MHIFYFLTPVEQFEVLREAASGFKSSVGIIFRRFTNSGLDSLFELSSWQDDLPSKYLEGRFSQIFIVLNGAAPNDPKDFDFYDREQNNLVVIEGGRHNSDELEQSYLRVFSKETNCKPLYLKIRKIMKSKTNQGVYANGSYYKNTLYSDTAATYKMVSSFGGCEFVKHNT